MHLSRLLISMILPVILGIAGLSPVSARPDPAHGTNPKPTLESTERSGASNPETAPPHVAAMQKLAWLEGTWEGEGTIQMGPGPKESYHQSETVIGKLDGAVLLIDGLGKDKADGRTVHRAFAVISFDAASGEYRVAAYTAEGQSVNATAGFEGDAFQWSFEAMGTKVRYTIRQGSAGEWLEIGEASRDGSTWRQFLEMKLTKTS